MTRFKDSVAIVTGAGVGIGFEVALQLVKEGASVVLNDVNEELANEASAKINGLSQTHNCTVVAGDSGDLNIINKMVNTAVNRYGKLDIAVANAGITLFAPFLEYKPEDFNKVLQLNLGGSFFLAQAAAKQIIRQQSKGSVLLMSSVTGHQAHKNLGAYGMTKAALEMLAKNLVIELSPYGITVNAVAPGATATERTLADETYTKVWSKLTPMGRPATTKDIAAAVLFLISPEAQHITGQTLVVDGGWTSISPSPYE